MFPVRPTPPTIRVAIEGSHMTVQIWVPVKIRFAILKSSGRGMPTVLRFWESIRRGWYPTALQRVESIWSFEEAVGVMFAR